MNTFLIVVLVARTVTINADSAETSDINTYCVEFRFLSYDKTEKGLCILSSPSVVFLGRTLMLSYKCQMHWKNELLESC